LNKLNEFFYSFSQDKRRIREFSEKHKNMRCFIIGNGPSLSIGDLEMLRDEITFAANRIYRLFDKTNWRPTYWVGSDLELLRSDKKHLLQVIENEMGATTFFITRLFKSFGAKANIYYYMIHHRLYIDRFQEREIEFSDSAERHLGNGETVTYIAMQLAVFMGFKEIYLLGVDNNYSNMLINGKLVCNNEIKNYSDGIRVEKHERFGPSNLTGLIASYFAARKYCDSHGILVANATRGGKLEVFERITLENILKKNLPQDFDL
jgi:hypothetical protein